MALQPCAACGHQISTRAVACPKCGTALLRTATDGSAQKTQNPPEEPGTSVQPASQPVPSHVTKASRRGRLRWLLPLGVGGMALAIYLVKHPIEALRERIDEATNVAHTSPPASENTVKPEAPEVPLPPAISVDVLAQRLAPCRALQKAAKYGEAYQCGRALWESVKADSRVDVSEVTAFNAKMQCFSIRGTGLAEEHRCLLSIRGSGEPDVASRLSAVRRKAMSLGGPGLRNVVAQCSDSLGSTDGWRLLREPGFSPRLDADPIVNQQLLSRVRAHLREDARDRQRHWDAQVRVQQVEAGGAQAEAAAASREDHAQQRRLDADDRTATAESIRCLRSCAPYLNCRGACGSTGGQACLDRCEALNSDGCSDCLYRGAARTMGF